MEKLKLHTPDLIKANVEKLASLFPQCVTEAENEDRRLFRVGVLAERVGRDRAS